MPNGPLNSARRLSSLVDLWTGQERGLPTSSTRPTPNAEKRTHDVLQSADIFTRYGDPRAEPNVEWLIQAKRGAEARVERSRQDICRRCLRDRCIV